MDYPVFAKLSKSQPAPSLGLDGQKSSCHTFLKAFIIIPNFEKNLRFSEFFSKIPKTERALSLSLDGQISPCHTFLKAFNLLFRMKKKFVKTMDFYNF